MGKGDSISELSFLQTTRLDRSHLFTQPATSLPYQTNESTPPMTSSHLECKSLVPDIPFEAFRPRGVRWTWLERLSGVQTNVVRTDNPVRVYQI